MKIYLVRGQTGAYPDRTDWTVCAFTEKEVADALAHQAEKWVLDKLDSLDRDSGEVFRFKFSDNPHDPKCICYGHYDGISYWTEEIELENVKGWV